MLEKIVEKRLKDGVRSIGGKAYKFSSPGNNGVPDRIVLYEGKVYFVELKRPGGKQGAIQKVVEKQFNKLGFKIYVIDTVEKVGEFIHGICTSQVSGKSH